MSQYLTLAEFRAITVMPTSDVDDIEAASAGWIAAQSTVVSGIIDARLRKRYAAPFDAPYPEPIRSWCSRILTLRAYLRRGVDARDAQFEAIVKDAASAEEEIKEAANAQDGLFELPLRSDLSTTPAVARGGCLGYSEASPYTWCTKQAEAVEDNGE